MTFGGALSPLVHLSLGAAISISTLHHAQAQPLISDVANAASYQNAVIAPGEIVVISGSGIGPAALATLKLDSGGNVATSLAGVEVTFNAIPSPLIYVSATAIAAIVPYEMAGLATAQLEVRYAGAISPPFIVKLASTMPGIFSADSSGTGNAAAANSDGSRNSAAHPAPPGSAVTFFLTGVGQTTPPASDGSIAAGRSGVNAPVTATIGGLPAQVIYAGGAPAEVAGIAQINAVVPPGLPYGGNLPLSVQIGNVTTQPGLTIAVDGAPAPLSVTTVFSPNSNTISTSEGAPYADCDIWGPVCTGASNFGYGPTKVMRLYICLNGMVPNGFCSQSQPATGPLSPAMLSGINSGIAAYAGTGVRLLIRFAYNVGPIGTRDAPLSLILTHLDQLAPILLQNRDLIFALEAGFIGTWGEWHDSTNGNDTAAAHQALLSRELGYFSGVFPILVRYPGDILQYSGNTTPPPGLGLHDDYFASAWDDAGTWDPCSDNQGYCDWSNTFDGLQSFAAAASTNAMFAGEFGAVYWPLQTCGALDAYSYTFRPQSIMLFPDPPDVGTVLQSQNCVLSFYNQVGTRIVLQQAAFTGNPIPGGRLSVALTLMNAGFGRVIRARPASLVLVRNGQSIAQIPIPLQSLDLRALDSFTSSTFQFDVSLPSSIAPSPVSLALLVPDPAPSLTSVPAYALPLNSLDPNHSPVFDASSGFNYIDGSGPYLGAAFQLDSAGSFTSHPPEVIDGAYSVKGSYNGPDSFTRFLETVPSALPLTANHQYQVAFHYRILTAPSRGFEALFYSPTAAAQGNYLPSTLIFGQTGDSGTAMLTGTLGPSTDYQVQWDIPGTGAIAIDDIQIVDLASGNVIAGANVEPALPAPLRLALP